MAIDYSVLPLSKGTPRVLEKATKRKVDAQAERACRVAVEMHHVVPRSRSSRLKWATSNNALLCKDHHGLRHAGKIQVTGNADEELIITGDVDLLKFRL